MLILIRIAAIVYIAMIQASPLENKLTRSAGKGRASRKPRFWNNSLICKHLYNGAVIHLCGPCLRCGLVLDSNAPQLIHILELCHGHHFRKFDQDLGPVTPDSDPAGVDHIALAGGV